MMTKLTGLEVVELPDSKFTIRFTYSDGRILDQDRYPTRERAERAIRRAFNR